MNRLRWNFDENLVLSILNTQLVCVKYLPVDNIGEGSFPFHKIVVFMQEEITFIGL